MPAGLEVYDRFGNLKVGIGHRLMRFLGYTIVSGSGSLTHNGLLTGTPFWISTMYSANGASYYPGDNMYPLSVWYSGNQLFWSFNAGMPTQILQYGVY